MGKTVSVSRVSAMCRGCPRRDWCKHIRMEAMACAVPDDLDRMNVAARSASPLVAEQTEPAAMKHNYRDVEIANGITIKIDLEDIRKKIIDDFYRGLKLASQGGDFDS